MYEWIQKVEDANTRERVSDTGSRDGSAWNPTSS